MKITPRSIKEELARSKHAYAKNEDVRCLKHIAKALYDFCMSRPVGPDKTDIEGKIREAFAEASKLEWVKKYMPKGLPYVKGQEKQIYSALLSLIKKIEFESSKEDIDAMRARKLKIDKSLILGSKFLEAGKLPEAQNHFHEAVNSYRDEHGLFPMIADRLIKAGFYKESLEYLRRAVEVAPDNPRVFDFLVTVSVKGQQQDAVDKIFESIEQSQAANAHRLAGLALLSLGKKNASLARDLAQQALALDPENTAAAMVMGRLQMSAKRKAAQA